MIIVSLALNVVVLVAVVGSFVAGAPWIQSAFGDRTPARDILLAIYCAILAGSAGLLLCLAVTPGNWVVGAVLALLAVQVIYKVLTAITVRVALRNPVVLSNLGIAVVHLVTIVTIIPMLQ